MAGLLQGKHRPEYSRHLLNGDFVVVVNAAQVDLSGKKLNQKRYYRHTGYPGHLREVPVERMLERHPDRVVERAVKGMLPRNRLGRRMLGRLKVYGGPTHPHQAQVNAGMGRPKQARPAREKALASAPKAAAKAPKRQAAPASEQPKAAQTAAKRPKAGEAPTKRQPRAAQAPARTRRRAPVAPDVVEEPAATAAPTEEAPPQEEKEE